MFSFHCCIVYVRHWPVVLGLACLLLGLFFFSPLPPLSFAMCVWVRVCARVCVAPASGLSSTPLHLDASGNMWLQLCGVNPCEQPNGTHTAPSLFRHTSFFFAACPIIPNFTTLRFLNRKKPQPLFVLILLVIVRLGNRFHTMSTTAWILGRLRSPSPTSCSAE